MGLVWWALLVRDADEEVLALILITYVLLLLMAFALTAVVFHKTGLSDPEQALGLPRGSVRALIAFMLLLIFALLTVFLFERVESKGVLEGVLVGDLQTVIESNDVTDAAETRRDADGNPIEYKVRVVGEENETRRDLAKQLTTALITLVVALTAFYFGARTSGTTTAELVKLATLKPNGDDQEAPAGQDKPLPVDDDAPLGGGAGTAAAPVPVTDPTTLGGSAPAPPLPVDDPEGLAGGTAAPAPPLPIEDPEELDGN